MTPSGDLWDFDYAHSIDKKVEAVDPLSLSLSLSLVTFANQKSELNSCTLYRFVI